MLELAEAVDTVCASSTALEERGKIMTELDAYSILQMPIEFIFGEESEEPLDCILEEANSNGLLSRLILNDSFSSAAKLIKIMLRMGPPFGWTMDVITEKYCKIKTADVPPDAEWQQKIMLRFFEKYLPKCEINWHQ